MNILKTVFLIPGYIFNGLIFLAWLSPTEWGPKRNTARTGRANSKSGRVFWRWSFSLLFWFFIGLIVLAGFYPVE